MRKLARGFSKATENAPIIHQARNKVQQDFDDEGENKAKAFFVETPVYTFTLPDMSIYPDDFRLFLEKDLIETSTLVSLENAGLCGNYFIQCNLPVNASSNLVTFKLVSLKVA